MFTTEGGSATTNTTATTGTTNGTTPPPVTNGAGTSTPPSWTEKFTPEQKGYIENKGFKEPGDMLTSYQNFEKLIGVPKERVLKLPENPDAPEWTEVYDKLGRPKNPTDYGIKPGDGDGPEFAEWAAKSFHELGLNKTQGEKLANKWSEFFKSAETAHKKAIDDKALIEEQSLKKEWGNAFDQEMQVAKQAAKAFGVDDEIANTLEKTIGFGKTMKFLNNVGKKMGESQFIDGQGVANSSFITSPHGAQQRLNQLMSDPVWSKNYLEGSHKEKSEMERLQKIIASGT